MIRLLAEHDRDQVMGLLAPESTVNLFIIGDVENSGFGQEFQQLWGDFDAAGRLRAVLLRYYGSFIPYAPGESELDGPAEVLIGHRDRITAFSGIDRVIRPFETYPGLLPENARKQTLSFLELRSGDRLAGPEGGGLGGQAFRAGPDDVPPYLRLGRRSGAGDWPQAFSSFSAGNCLARVSGPASSTTTRRPGASTAASASRTPGPG